MSSPKIGRRNVLLSIIIFGGIFCFTTFVSQEYLSTYIATKLMGNNNRQNHKNAYENKTQNMDQIFQEKLRLSILFRERRERIGKICEREGGKNPELKKANSLSGDKTWNMYFDYEDSLLVCTIDKVGSTNWYIDFLMLAMIRNPSAGFSWNTTRDEIRDVHYRIKSGNYSTLLDDASQMMTVTFVRHPFERLVSAYFDKIARNNKRFFPPIRKYIIEKYRKRPLAKDEPLDDWQVPFPTPFEFIQYFFDEIPSMGDVKNVNRHFASQTTQCPFCSVDFDVVGKKETFGEDMKAVLEASKLDKLLNASSKINGGHSNESFHFKFFSQLPKRLIVRLFDYYELDFQMFGYDYPKEFISMGFDQSEEQIDEGIADGTDLKTNTDDVAILEKDGKQVGVIEQVEVDKDVQEGELEYTEEDGLEESDEDEVEQLDDEKVHAGISLVDENEEFEEEDLNRDFVN